VKRRRRRRRTPDLYRSKSDDPELDWLAKGVGTLFSLLGAAVWAVVTLPVALVSSLLKPPPPPPSGGGQGGEPKV